MTESEREGEWRESAATTTESELPHNHLDNIRLTSQESGKTYEFPLIGEAERSPVRVLRSEVGPRRLTKQRAFLRNLISPAGAVGAFFRSTAVLGFIGGIAQIMNGDFVGGFVQISMGVTQFAEIIGKLIPKKIANTMQKFGRALGRAAVRSLTQTIAYLGRQVGVSTRAAARVSVAAGRGVMRIFRYIGFAFDIYFIIEDFHRLNSSQTDVPKWLIKVEIALDFAIFFAGILAMSNDVRAVAAVVILTVARLSIEWSYRNAKWMELHCEDMNIHFCRAVGTAMGLADVAVGGLINTHLTLRDAESIGKQSVEVYTDINNYAIIEGDCDHGKSRINFLLGPAASAAGLINFELGNDQTYEYSTEIVSYGEANIWASKVGKCESLRDVVLGVGEIPIPVYEKAYAKIHGFDTGKKFTILTEMNYDDYSLTGSYEGNDKDNSFYGTKAATIQSSTSNCFSLDPEQQGFYLHHYYYYSLEGRGGNDIFLLGPHDASLDGGDGNDQYHISSAAKQTTIYNYADDGREDFLFINVTYRFTHEESIRCFRSDNNLVITYCRHGAEIIVSDWFSSSHYRHLTFLSSDGVRFKDFSEDKENHETVECHQVELDFSEMTENLKLALNSSTKYKHIEAVIGPQNHTSYLVGNSLPNVLICSKGGSYLEGSGGEDRYQMLGSGAIEINNCDFQRWPEDVVVDHLMINDTLANIFVERSDHNLIIRSTGLDQSFKIHHWFSNPTHCQHLLITTADKNIFSVQELDSDKLVKALKILDFTDSPHGVVVDLFSGIIFGFPRGTDTSDIITVISSRNEDTIVGNALNNIFDCKSANVDLKGNDGVDIYFIRSNCFGVIQTCSDDGETDRLIMSCSFSKLEVCTSEGTKLILETGNYHNESYSVIGRYTQIVSIRIEAADWRPYCCDLDLQTFSRLNSTFEHTVNIELHIQDWKSFRLRGNSKANWISLGRRHGNSITHLEGRNGSDYYKIGNRHNLVTINNFARDAKLDFLQLPIAFDNIIVSHPDVNGTIVLKKQGQVNESIRLEFYWLNKTYQHLMVISEEGYLFQLTEEFPYKAIQSAEKTQSKFPEHLQFPEDERGYQTAKQLKGSVRRPNHIFGTANSQNIRGGARDDYIIGGPGAETISGSEGDDDLRGKAGADYLNGGAGNDILKGGSGNDVLNGGRGSDILTGGAGTDTAIFQGTITEDGYFVGMEASLIERKVKHRNGEEDSLKEIEVLVGTLWDDILEDDEGDNTLIGGPGDDLIIGHGGLDYYYGGSGMDIYDLRNASGLKKILNFENGTNDSHDWISVADRIRSEAQRNNSLCSYKYDSDLVLEIDETLAILIEGFYVETHYQHVQLMTTSEGASYALTDIVPLFKIEKKMFLEVNVTGVTTNSIIVNTNCTNCQGALWVFYSSTSTTSSKHQEVSVGRGEIRNLKPGTLYLLLPVIILCARVADRFDSVSAVTEPSKVTSVRAKVAPFSSVKVSWDLASEISSPGLSYEANILARIHSKSNVTTHNRTVEVGGAFIFIPMPMQCRVLEIYFQVRALAFGNPGNWSLIKKFSFRLCFGNEEIESGNCIHPTRLAKPTQYFCRAPTTGNFALIKRNFLSNRSFSEYDAFSQGSRIDVNCLEGFRFGDLDEGEMARSTCNSAEWVPRIPLCGPTSKA